MHQCGESVWRHKPLQLARQFCERGRGLRAPQLVEPHLERPVEDNVHQRAGPAEGLDKAHAKVGPAADGVGIERRVLPAEFERAVLGDTVEIERRVAAKRRPRGAQRVCLAKEALELRCRRQVVKARAVEALMLLLLLLLLKNIGFYMVFYWIFT